MYAKEEKRMHHSAKKQVMLLFIDSGRCRVTYLENK